MDREELSAAGLRDAHNAEDPYKDLGYTTSGKPDYEDPFPASNPGVSTKRSRADWESFDSNSTQSAYSGKDCSNAVWSSTGSGSHVTGSNPSNQRPHVVNDDISMALETLHPETLVGNPDDIVQDSLEEQHLGLDKDSGAPSGLLRELILPLPLQRPQVRLVIAVATIQLLCGIVLVLIGVVISGILGGSRSTRNGPQLWWTGILPFLLGFSGIYAGGKKRRKWVWQWGVASLLVTFTQCAVMGLVGNFSTSNYDVWLHTGWRYNKPMCQQRFELCYCQDFEHGTYSHVEISGISYIYEKVMVGDWEETIKWREVRFNDCSDVPYVSRIYLSHMAVWGLYCLTSVIGCIIAHAVSVCASQDVKYRHRLKDEIEETDPEREKLADCVHSEQHIAPDPENQLTGKQADNTSTYKDIVRSEIHCDTHSPQTVYIQDSLPLTESHCLDLQKHSRKELRLEVDVDVHMQNLT